MNVDNMRTFLQVAYCHSITQAANNLFVSQPTVSMRIQQLESELRTNLIIRKKGMRNVELTPEGTAFISIAERWLSLETETAQFRDHRINLPLTIACPDSLNVYVLNRFFRSLSESFPTLRLSIHTHQSPEIFSLVSSRKVDVGFVFLLSHYPNIICSPIYSEAMVLLCSSNGTWPNRPIRPEELDPASELFLPWSQDVHLWHDKLWNPQIMPFVTVDMASLIAMYMDRPNSWAICPISVANSFIHNKYPVKIHPITTPIPDRVCYMLTNRPSHETEQPTIKMFRQELIRFLSSVDGFRVLISEQGQK